MTPKEYIQLRAPGYYSKVNLDAMIILADKKTGEYDTQELRDEAIALLVCHWYAKQDISSNGTVVGTITSESEGEISRSYGGIIQNTIDNTDLASTSWGIELYNLQRLNVFPYNRLTID